MSRRTLKWEIDTDEAVALVEQMLAAMESYEEPLEEGAFYMRTKFQENFDSQGSQVGGWAPLSPRTSAWRASHGYPPQYPILVNEGDLRAHVMGMQQRVDRDEVTMSVNHRLAPFHQYGSPKVKLPKREILFEPDGFGDLMARRLEGHIIPGRMTSELRNLFQR